MSTIDWDDWDCKVSEYFTVGEVTQRDKQRIPKTEAVKANVVKLAKELDKVRQAWGKPIEVTSWYRPPAVNKAVGGVSNSQHINGSAADIRPIGGDIHAFQKWLDKFWGDKALGYGAKKGFVHVDLRLGKIRWNY
jgi:uncharacterized protein YcbK (DUF882 family)